MFSGGFCPFEITPDPFLRATVKTIQNVYMVTRKPTLLVYYIYMIRKPGGMEWQSFVTPPPATVANYANKRTKIPSSVHYINNNINSV